MARLPRFVIPGQPQHIIQRGNNREPIFFSDEDYQFYKEKLLDCSKKHDCEIHAYVMMTNHVHLLATPHSEDGLSKLMQSLGRYYVQYINYYYEHTGTLWEGRYKATLIDSNAYLLTCMQYIELNPVRAGMVAQPGEYPWSSYSHNVQGKADELVTQHMLYKKLGSTEAERRKAYRQLVRSSLNDVTINDIREATNKAWVLGSDRFKNKVEKQLERRVTPKVRGGDRKSKEYREKARINRV
jgi:putative transposase